MKALIITLVIIGVGTVSFIAGRKSALEIKPFTIASAPIAAVKGVPSSPETKKAAPSPTQFDRELMSSLNAIQSSVETGLNSSRYSELISTARTKLADLKLYSPESPLISPTESYLHGHNCVLSIWKCCSAEDVLYITQEKDPELYEFARRAHPNGHVMEMNLPNHTYEVRGGIGVLWRYTEGMLWRDVMDGWKRLNV